jgi:sarcosine oxidase subunit gamma
MADAALVSECSLAIAAVIARRGQGEALKARVAEAYGLTLPDGPRRVAGASLAAIGTAPGAWLFTARSPDPRWAQGLGRVLQGLASVADQSDAYIAVRLAGPAAGAILAKGIGLDLHPEAFPVGAAAVTTAAHLGLILWREEADAYVVLSFRSYAESFRHWLTETGAEFGLQARA